MGESSAARPSVERVEVEGACPGCGASALQSYPVISEGGWFLVTKCQECLSSTNRAPWNPLGYVTREVGTL